MPTTVQTVSYTHLDVYKRQILHRYGLPTETGYALDKLYEAELVDKKISGGKMHLLSLIHIWASSF